LRLAKSEPGHINPIHPEIKNPDQMILRDQFIE
jgi:hypothetical protein